MIINLNKIQKNEQDIINKLKRGKNMDKKENIEDSMNEVGEDATQYGEFISTYFAWVSLPKQKETVEKLENITKKKKK